MALILVVEDNEVNLELMTFLLQAHGHRTLAARDGVEGVALARQARPDLVICDVQMPGMDGHAVAAAMRADPATATMPLVAVTAAAMVGDRDRALAAGFDLHVSKPIEPAEFMRQLEALLIGTVTRPPPPPAPGDQAASAVAPSLRAPHAGARLLLVDDEALLQELKRCLLEPAGYQVLEAASAEAAWALLQEQPVDLVVSDVVMPGMSGFALLQRLRADPRLGRQRFVFLTSTARDEASRRAGLALGANGYLIRPIEPERLLGALREVLERPDAR